MKTTLTLLIFLFASFSYCKGQIWIEGEKRLIPPLVDTVDFTVGEKFFEFRVAADDSNFVSMNIHKEDTIYTVVGDSLTAIKLMFKYWKISENEEQKKTDMWREVAMKYRKLLDSHIAKTKKLLELLNPKK